MADSPDKIKIELTAYIGNHAHQATKRIIEVDADDWSDMDAGERDEFMKEELNKIVGWDYREVKDDE